MTGGIEIGDRRTSADIVFDDLFERIVSLDLLPGAKMSEVEIAKQFGVSRQPVRDAFGRLASQGLLIVRPQKATVVRRFSLAGIANARFLRLAVELEVLRCAAAHWPAAYDTRADVNLDAQRAAVAAGDAERFHALDYEFHKLLCEAADADFAFETIAANKAQVDRLCVLSLQTKAAMAVLVADHDALIGAIRAGDVAGTESAIRRHLARLDPTIERIHASHRDYFAD